jgi:hypothetical protein
MPISGPMIAGVLASGLMDRETAKSTNKANILANRESIQDAQRSRDESRRALTGTAGNVQTSMTPGGGFDSQFLKGTSGDILNRGDVGRAGAANRASNDFKFNLPNMGAAQGMVDRDNALAQSSFDDSFNKAMLRNTQAGGQGGVGSASSNYAPKLAGDLGRVADSLRLNREQNALGLLQGSQEKDISNLQQQIQANASLAPSIQGVGPSAAQINAQIPLAARTSDLGGAVNSAAGGNIVSQIMQQQALEDSQAKQLQLIRTLGNQGAFGTSAQRTT